MVTTTRRPGSGTQARGSGTQARGSGAQARGPRAATARRGASPARGGGPRTNTTRARATARANRKRESAELFDPRRRLMFVLGVFVIVGVLFVGALVDLQSGRATRLRDLGESQRSGTKPLAGYRGSILDRDGFVLAASTPALELVADPQLIVDPAVTASVLAPALGIDADALISPLTPTNEEDRYGLLATALDDAAVGRVAELLQDDQQTEQVAGVVLRPIEERVYPADTLARPVVGAVDPDENGSFGIEWQFQQYLQGQGGLEHFERGLFGSITGGAWSVEPAQPGSDVVLTIDHRIQYVVEEALIEHCQEMNARSANSVVADPRTGEILAMATVLRGDDGQCYVPRYNAPIVDTFEPGSVLKMITFAAAVNDLGYTRDTSIAVPSSIRVGDKDFPDHPRHPPADFPISQIAADSMNVGTIKLAQQIGPERLQQYLMAFGFGQESGLGFKDEAIGRVPSTWHGSEQGSIPIGQGITVNSVQLLSAYNAIANDGVYVAPKLIRSLVAPDGTKQLPEPQEARTIVSATAADEVTSMLEGVVETGTGTAASVPGYSVAGKTGTAWKVFGSGPNRGTYGTDGDRKYVVTFAGFLPAENPQLSIVVVVDEPTVQTTAGKVAAPVFADIAHYVLRILGIPPERLEAEPNGPVRGVPAGVDPDWVPRELSVDDAPESGHAVSDSGVDQRAEHPESASTSGGTEPTGTTDQTDMSETSTVEGTG